MSTNNGGPAFPVHGQRWDRVYGYEQVNFPGLSIRDYFAAKAMAAMVGSDAILKFTDQMADLEGFHRGEWMAEQAFKFADCMLAERAK